MAREVIVTADKIKRQKRFRRIIKLTLLALLLFLIITYVILRIIYNEGRFTITLNSNKTLESGIAIYDNLDDTSPKRRLEAIPILFMDNISWKWLPANIDVEKDGSHNGNNYIAYSFYVENQGNLKLNYWYEVIVDEVVRRVDDAIRIMIFQNEEKTVYAKKNSLSGGPEEGTVSFIEDKEDILILEERKNFMPGDRDRYTIVIWIEGDDPDCVDYLKGGAMKMHMNLTEEHVKE